MAVFRGLKPSPNAGIGAYRFFFIPANTQLTLHPTITGPMPITVKGMTACCQGLK